MVALLEKHFVAFALSNAGWTMNMTPAEAAWLKDRGGRACTQGMAVFTAGGRMLGTGGGYTAAPNVRMLREALGKYRPEEAVEVGDPTTPIDPREVPEGWRPFLPRVVPRPARDGIVLYVTWKALDRDPRMLLMDRIWASKAEAEALAAGMIPDRLKQRLAVHVGFVMDSKVRSIDLAQHEQGLSGSFLLENGERCPARGLIAVKAGKVRRFELIVKGRSDGKAGKGSGFPSLGVEVPPGKKVAAAVAFLLADPNDELARVQPGSGKDLGGGAEKSTARK